MSSYDEHLISQAGGDGDPLDQIQRRADKATPGPWVVDELGDVETVPEFDLHRFDIMPDTIARTELRKEDGVFIAHARTDVPYLLALVREQQARILRVRAIEKRLAKSKYCEDCEIAEDIRAALTATEEA